VSLNAQLLFLPREFARYVLHHELCHAAHPDHSRAFWARLARFEPDARHLRARMRDGWQYVPGWLSYAPSGTE
jgi:predicted metal-dependent hydrolase